MLTLHNLNKSVFYICLLFLILPLQDVHLHVVHAVRDKCTNHIRHVVLLQPALCEKGTLDLLFLLSIYLTASWLVIHLAYCLRYSKGEKKNPTTNAIIVNKLRGELQQQQQLHPASGSNDLLINRLVNQQEINRRLFS